MSHSRIQACTRQALLLAWLLSGTVFATTETLPPDLVVKTGLNDLEWIVTNTAGSSGTAFTGDCDGSVAGLGISEAKSATGATDAFDNAWMLFVDGVVLATPTVDLSGELLTAGPVVLSGLNTTLEFLFSGSLQAARIRAIFDNPTNAAITVNVDVPINLGSDADAMIEQTSNNTDFTTADRWIVTSDSSITTEPVITTVIYGPGTPTATPSASSPSLPPDTVCMDSKGEDQGIGFSFTITIPANSSRSLMFFAGLGAIQGTSNSVTVAIANAAMFNNNNNIDTRLLNDLSNSERLGILNWDFAATIAAAAAAATDDEDTTFIDDFIGCSLGNRKANDPTFLLLVLLALTGLLRKRPPHISKDHQ